MDENLRTRLKTINDEFLTTPDKQELKPLETVRKAVYSSILTKTPISESDMKQLHHGHTSEFMQNWINKTPLKALYIKDGKPCIDISGKIRGKVPIQDELSIKDNLHILFHYLNIYYKSTYNGCFSQTPYSKDPIATQTKDISHASITTGLAYHYLIFETITENFSIDLTSLDGGALEKRINTGYSVLSKISSGFEHSLLVMIDSISTEHMKNPFTLDDKNNEISIKEEILKTICLMIRLYNAKKENSSEIDQLHEELKQEIHRYADNDEMFPAAIDAIERALEVKTHELFGCPAHRVKTDGSNLFKNLFFISIESFKTHYSFLRKNKPELLSNPDKLVLGNESIIMSDSTQKTFVGLFERGHHLSREK